MADNKLHTAVRYGNEEDTLQALKEGFNPNEIGMLRWSPVHEAAHNGERDILKMLLLYKGEVNQTDGLHGNTPLHYAAQEDNSACVTVLLKAGAKLDLKNDQGRTPLDIATPSCQERMEPFLHNAQNTTGQDWQPGGAKTKDQTRWEGLDDVPSDTAIGSLHLSFEYHKQTLKVRVWQITDLLLPPPQTSMIESIFVRGYFIPDPAKKSQRKTEVVFVDPSSKERSRRPSSPPRGGIQHIFTPSSFRFDSPLLYTGVTDEMVSQRSLQLEVCMVQKNTHKHFLVAMVHMPLRTAVRRPIREKYPLIPCMNYTIPNSMRVYSAKDIFMEGTSDVVVSFSRSNSLQSNPDSTHSSSDNHLGGLQDIRVDYNLPPSKSHTRKLISVNIEDSCEDDVSDNDNNKRGDDVDDDDEDVDDGIGSLDVKICSGKGSASSSVTVDVLDTSLNGHEGESNNNNDDDDDDVMGGVNLKGVVIHRTGSFGKETSVVNIVEDVNSSLDTPNVDDEQKNKKKRIIPIELLVKSNDDNDDDEEEENRHSYSRQSSRSNNTNEVVEVESTVIEVEGPVKETVVDMTKLGKDTVVDMDGMTDSGYDNESVQSESSPMSETKDLVATMSSKRKKKIIPVGFANDESRSDEENVDNNNTVISQSAKTITTPDNVEKDDDDDEDVDEISSEINNSTHRLQSSSSQLSSESSSKEKSSTPITGSRPETPVWDFYDFACDQQGSEGVSLEAEGQGPTNSNSDSTNPDSKNLRSSSSSKVPPTSPITAASTLQESLARLSRQQPVLDTCHVSGPVLPSIMIMEDFEMDEDN